MLETKVIWISWISIVICLSTVSNTAAAVDLYYFPPSPPCRAVIMLAKAINLDINMKLTNLMEGDHLKPDFIKMNPQHTIPTMVDDGLIVWESRAILAYFVNQYGPDDSLYPKDPKMRAIIDHRLNFDLGTLSAKFVSYYMKTLFAGAPLDPEKLKPLQEALNILNIMLDGSKFTAGDKLSIADFSIITTISNMDAFGFDLTPYPNVKNWYDMTKEAMMPFGYEEINQAGANMLGDMFKAKNKA